MELKVGNRYKTPYDALFEITSIENGCVYYVNIRIPDSPVYVRSVEEFTGFYKDKAGLMRPRFTPV